MPDNQLFRGKLDCASLPKKEGFWVVSFLGDTFLPHVGQSPRFIKKRGAPGWGKKGGAYAKHAGGRVRLKNYMFFAKTLWSLHESITALLLLVSPILIGSLLRSKPSTTKSNLSESLTKDWVWIRSNDMPLNSSPTPKNGSTSA